MYQETEQGIWKPVLGALCAASVILTLIGSLVFSPQPSLLPTLKMADSEGQRVDRSNSRRSSTVMFVPAVQSRQVDQLRSQNTPSNANTVIVDRPIVTAPAESQNLPCDTASDVLVADEAQRLKKEPSDQVDLAGRPVDLPNSPVAIESEVLVAEQTPAAESALPFQQAPQAGPSIASQSASNLPVDRSESPDQNAGQVSVAACGSGQPASPIAEDRESHPLPVAVENPAAVVVVQKLSHYERKMRRKLAHLEKKRTRLFNSDCSLVCR